LYVRGIPDKTSPSTLRELRASVHKVRYKKQFAWKESQMVSTAREIGMKGESALKICGAAAVALALILASGCGAEGHLEDRSVLRGGTGFGVRFAAVKASCAGATRSFGISGELTATVTGPGISDPIEATGNVNSGSGLTLANIPEGNQRVITVTGTMGDTQTEVFSRESAISVVAQQDIDLDMLLVPRNDFGCLEVTNEFGNILFPAVVGLPDGRVVIAGGYQSVTQTGTTFELTSPSDKVFLFDGHRGTFQRVPNLMKEGRGAAQAIYIPGRRQVLIVGGSNKLRYDPGQGGFPFSFVGTDAMHSYEVLSMEALDRRLVNPQGAACSTDDDCGGEGEICESTGCGLPIFLEPPADGNTPNRMTVGRVFPQLLLLEGDDAVLVTGGGSWPQEANQSYLYAEYYHPKAFQEQDLGGFVDPGQTLGQHEIRAGHTIIPIGLTSSGFTRALMWGGTATSELGEVFHQGSASGTEIWGSFRPVALSGELGTSTYFHAAAPLLNDKVLVVGGVEPSGGRLVVPSAGRAFILSFNEVDGSPVITSKEIPGMGAPRYFGALGVSADTHYATLVGGWTDDIGTPSTSPVYADLFATSPAFVDSGAQYAGAGGMGSGVLSNDAILLIGGTADISKFDPNIFGRAETFAPGILAGDLQTEEQE
jgi:hypothetical protein